MRIARRRRVQVSATAEHDARIRTFHGHRGQEVITEGAREFDPLSLPVNNALAGRL